MERLFLVQKVLDNLYGTQKKTKGNRTQRGLGAGVKDWNVYILGKCLGA